MKMKRFIGKLSTIAKSIYVKLLICLLVASTYGAFIFSVFNSEKHLEFVTSLAFCFSSISLAGTIGIWILVSARLLSTHEFKFLDIKSAINQPTAKSNDPLAEENLDEFAKKTTDKLFGREKTLTDHIS